MPLMHVTLGELATLLSLNIVAGDPEAEITGFASLNEATAGDLSFFSDMQYRQRLQQTRASAVLVPISFDCEGLPAGLACVAAADPSGAFESVVDRYGWQPEPFRPGIHATAVIDDSVAAPSDRISVGPHAVIAADAVIEDEVEIGAGCYVGRGVRIGRGTRLFANSTVHEGSIIGERVILHSGVVIGADGFGYEFKNGRHRKIRQAGIVQIDDDVEIGAGTTVDRARFGRTWIGEGTKIDNLVQIAHNVVIGKHCIIVAGTGIAGSAVIGDYVVIAAQSGVGGHVTVGSQATLAARSGVTKDLPGGATYMGFPAAPAKDERRRLVAQRRIPQLLERVRLLEEELSVRRRATAEPAALKSSSAEPDVAAVNGAASRSA